LSTGNVYPLALSVSILSAFAALLNLATSWHHCLTLYGSRILNFLRNMN